MLGVTQNKGKGSSPRVKLLVLHDVLSDCVNTVLLAPLQHPPHHRRGFRHVVPVPPACKRCKHSQQKTFGPHETPARNTDRATDQVTNGTTDGTTDQPTDQWAIRRRKSLSLAVSHSQDSNGYPLYVPFLLLTLSRISVR